MGKNGDLGRKLNRMTKEGHWDKLPGEITDEMLEAFAVVGDPVSCAEQMHKRFAGYIDRATLEAKFAPEILEQQMNILRSPA